MYTAYPDPLENVQSTPVTKSRSAADQAMAEHQALVGRIHNFLTGVKAEDLAGLTGKREKTEYLNMHRSLKTKGGRPPMDYSAVEDLVDLRRAVAAGDYLQAAPLYFRLNRLLNA